MKTFVMMTGIARSGKSSWVKHEAEMLERDNKTYTICSSDAIREEIGMETYDPKRNQEVFKIMQERAVEGLKNTDVVFYDATNLNDRKREMTIEAIHKAVGTSFKVLHVFVLVEPEVLYERALAHNFPIETIDKQMRSFQSLGSVAYEHFIMGERDVMLVYTGKQTQEEYAEFLYDKSTNFDQNTPYHKHTLHGHSQKTANLTRDLGDFGDDIEVDMVALSYFHDLGKLYTRQRKKDGTSTYPGHAGVSTLIFLILVAMEIKELNKHIDISSETLIMATLIQEHMNIKFIETEKAMRKLMSRLAEPETVPYLLVFSMFDKLAQK